MNRSMPLKLLPFLQRTAHKRGLIFGAIILCALMAFEVFNYSSTLFALGDILGDLAFGPIKWSMILAFAFCGIDFAGIARIFTPEQGRDEPAEVWYLFGAWLLAASFNAILTWWGVSVAILNHNALGGALVGTGTMTRLVPIFVAVMVWLVRVLIIGTFSLAGERLFTSADTRPHYQPQRQQAAAARPVQQPVQTPPMSYPRPAAPRPTPTNTPVSGNNIPRPVARPEPTYHPVGVSARSDGDPSSSRS